MTWSDASRAAALAARRAHMKGRSFEQQPYSYQRAKMNQAEALLRKAFTYKGDSMKIASALFHYDVGRANYSRVDYHGATKAYMQALKGLRAARTRSGTSAGKVAASTYSGGSGARQAAYMRGVRTGVIKPGKF